MLVRQPCGGIPLVGYHVKKWIRFRTLLQPKKCIPLPLLGSHFSTIYNEIVHKRPWPQDTELRGTVCDSILAKSSKKWPILAPIFAILWRIQRTFYADFVFTAMPTPPSILTFSWARIAHFWACCEAHKSYRSKIWFLYFFMIFPSFSEISVWIPWDPSVKEILRSTSETTYLNPRNPTMKSELKSVAYFTRKPQNKYFYQPEPFGLFTDNHLVDCFKTSANDSSHNLPGPSRRKFQLKTLNSFKIAF